MAFSKKSSGMADFEALLNAQLSAFRSGFNPGERVMARIASIGPEMIALDVRAKNEGLVPTGEFRDAAGQLTVSSGDEVQVVFVAVRDGAFIFSAKETSVSVDRTIAQAFDSGLPIEGKVQAEINGGYEVMIAGCRAFCPYSQISLFRQDGVGFVGQTFPFLVQEYDPEERNIVVSRRALLERERESARERLKEELTVGTTRIGKVTRITDFGFFVELGGVEGLVSMRELSWRRNVSPADVVKEGDTVEVMVCDADWDRNRISLSLRATETDPFIAAADKYPIGSAVTAKITHLEPFGAFAEIVPGVEGLIPISLLGNGRRIVRPSEVVSEGQEVLLRIETIDREKRRIGLRPLDARIEGMKPQSLAVGSKLRGIVEAHKDFGVFVRLSEKDTGLLHVSEAGVSVGGSSLAKLEQAYPHGSEIEVVVKANDGRRISLVKPENWNPGAAVEEAKAMETFKKTNSSDSLGSLADAFAGLKL